MVKTTGKVQRLPRKNGVALAFKIVHNFWDSVKQVGTNKLIKPILYIPAGQNLNDVWFRLEAWNKIDKTLTNLCLQKVVSSADADKAKRNFAKVLPRVQKRQPIASGKPDPLAKYRNILKS
jgi:hypothetical protein